MGQRAPLATSSGGGGAADRGQLLGEIARGQLLGERARLAARVAQDGPAAANSARGWIGAGRKGGSGC
jgi:hypothetical protein